MTNNERLIKKYIDILKKNPDCASSLHNLGKLYVKQREKIKAKMCYEKLYKIMPENFDVLRTFGLLLLANGEKVKALEMFKKALFIKEDERDIYEYVTEIDKFHEEKCFELALASYDENKITQTESTHCINVAKRLYRRGNYDMAERYIKLASNVATNSAEVNNLIGAMCYKNGQYNRAIYFYNYALNTLKKDNVVILFNILHAYKQKKDYEKVEEYLQKIFEIKYSNKYVLNMIARIYKEIGQNDKAKDFFEKVLEIDDTFVEAQQYIASLYI